MEILTRPADGRWLAAMVFAQRLTPRFYDSAPLTLSSTPSRMVSSRRALIAARLRVVFVNIPIACLYRECVTVEWSSMAVSLMDPSSTVYTRLSALMEIVFGRLEAFF